MAKRIHFKDDAGTARANHNKSFVMWCGQSISGSDFDWAWFEEALTRIDAVTCPTCKRLLKRAGYFG